VLPESTTRPLVPKGLRPELRCYARLLVIVVPGSLLTKRLRACMKPASFLFLVLRQGDLDRRLL
jgi:hypothetical protein